jgi:hypothetical protein
MQRLREAEAGDDRLLLLWMGLEVRAHHTLGALRFAQQVRFIEPEGAR